MTLFEGVVLLLFVSAFLLVGARRLGIPYPTLLALAGVGIALLPGTPSFRIDPTVALAVFIAPVLLDASFDTSPHELRRLWLPLVILAIGLVLLTAGAVALVGWQVAGLSPAVALTLGAIVAPPDAAAANAVLGQVGLPRRSYMVLQGEGLLNDAAALLLFSAALAMARDTAPEGGALALTLAAPGGIALGLAAAWLSRRTRTLFEGTLSATIVEFTTTIGVWLVADRLHLSPILAVVALGMALARTSPLGQSARDRVQSFSVWASAVFMLNVLAFLLMGFEVRDIVQALPSGELLPALGLAAAVLGTVVAVRILALLAYRFATGRIRARLRPAVLDELPPWRLVLVTGWAGMRGLVTLAIAFALPADFPDRERIVLAATAVVLGTLVIQGLTLGPLMRRLGVQDDGAEVARDLGAARLEMLEAGMEAAARERKDVADTIRIRLRAARDVASSDDPQGATAFDKGVARTVAAQRRRLAAMRADGRVGEHVFQRLQEELDWLELAATPNRELEVREA